MGKSSLTILAILMAAAATAPASAQEAAKEKPKPATTATPVRPGGAVSSSYARCVPGNPIGGVIVKGGSNSARPTAGEAPEGACPSGEPAEGRTYTGGRRNADVPATNVEAGAIAPVTKDQMPSRLSMTPTTARTTAEPPASAEKSISEQGVAASKPSKPH